MTVGISMESVVIDNHGMGIAIETVVIYNHSMGIAIETVEIDNHSMGVPIEIVGIYMESVVTNAATVAMEEYIKHHTIFACQSFFIGEEERRFRLLSEGPSEATCGSSQLFSVLFLVPVSLPKNEIYVNICLPSQDVSDCHSTGIIESHPVKYLTPLELTATLPPKYPSSASPKITLSSSWLNGAQLTSLCSQLIILWEDYEGMPILNTWIDWLEHNTLSYLGIEDGVNLQISGGSSAEWDERVGFEFNNVEETLNDLFRYNQQEEAVDFINHDQECSICFTEKSGRDFYSFLPCKHYYCKECVADFCSIHVKDGTVQQLQCLETSCKSEMKPYIMKEVLDKEEFKRWEQLTFQKGLDSMGDISYCPRCEIAIITEENSLNMAHCEMCQFSFCLECSEPVHPGEICFFKKENKEEEKNDIEGENEKEFQQKLKRMAESKSHEFLKEKSKKCPVCKVKIIKAGGCNHVVCTVCKSSMCWACGQDTTQGSYTHFQESPDCSLYIFNEHFPPETNEPPMIIQDLNTALGLGKTIDHVMCPECTENNLRQQNFNHVICWKCSTNFCYLCKKRLHPPIARHFLRTKCSKYSDN